jgi:hypothetical protein
MEELIVELRKGLNPIKDLNTWGYQNIDYVSDKNKMGVKEFWQTPDETFADLSGDCDDFSIFYCHILAMLGYEPILLAVSSQSKGGHAVCVVYDSQIHKNIHISNWGYYQTNARTLKGVALAVFPDMYWFKEYDYNNIPKYKRLRRKL